MIHRGWEISSSESLSFSLERHVMGSVTDGYPVSSSARLGAWHPLADPPARTPPSIWYRCSQQLRRRLLGDYANFPLHHHLDRVCLAWCLLIEPLGTKEHAASWFVHAFPLFSVLIERLPLQHVCLRSEGWLADLTHAGLVWLSSKWNYSAYIAGDRTASKGEDLLPCHTRFGYSDLQKYLDGRSK